MIDPSIIHILNELLAAERSSAAHRLIESTVFVTQVGSDEYLTVQRLAEEQTEHAAWLTSMIIDLGGSPGMRLDDLATANLHYQELHTALPNLVSHLERIIHKYQMAVPKLATEPAAAEIAGRILARHQENHRRLASHDDAPAAATS